MRRSDAELTRPWIPILPSDAELTAAEEPPDEALLPEPPQPVKTAAISEGISRSISMPMNEAFLRIISVVPSSR